MTSYRAVMNFYDENAEIFRNDGLKRHHVKQALKTGLLTPSELLPKLQAKLERIKHKQAQFNEVAEEINNFDLKEESKNLIEGIDRTTWDILPDPAESDLIEPKNKLIRIIETSDINNKRVNIWFNTKSKTKFEDIRQTIVNKLNEFKGVENVYFAIYYTVGNDKRRTIYSLNNEYGMSILNKLLQSNTYDLINNYVDNRDTVIECSDTNKDNINALTIDMITGISFYTVQNEKDKGINIYCDNGGSFYKYKINDCFESCEPLLNILKRYQITNNLIENKNLFNINCITYALKMSGNLMNQQSTTLLVILLLVMFHTRTSINLAKNIILLLVLLNIEKTETSGIG